MPRAALDEEQIEAYRDRVLTAAEHLFAGSGYTAVTMRAIASELGCSPMTPYRYVGGKAEVFALVKARGFGRFAARQEEAVAGHSEPMARLAALGRAYVSFAMEEPDAYCIMFELDGDQGDQDYSVLTEQERRAWLPLLGSVTAAIESGHLGGDPETVAHVFWAGLHGLVSLDLAGKFVMGRDVGDIGEAMMLTLVRGNSAVL